MKKKIKDLSENITVLNLVVEAILLFLFIMIMFFRYNPISLFFITVLGGTGLIFGSYAVIYAAIRCAEKVNKNIRLNPACYFGFFFLIIVCAFIAIDMGLILPED